MADAMREMVGEAAEPSSSERMTAKDPATKLARKRLSVLQLAESLGNVSEACRRGGLDRTSFYEWRRRFQTHGLEGLKDLPPVHKSHPQTTPPEVVERLLALSMEHPTWGCNRLSDMLRLEGPYVSGPTVQSILSKHGVGSRYERLLRLEERAAQTAIPLTAEQVAQIERANPCFRERHVKSSRPGELLSQDTFYVGTLKGVGKVYLQAVVDTYGSYAFGFVHTTKRPECAVAVLYNDVLPFYEAQGLTVGAVLTDNGREFCGTEHHPYELYLALEGIEHRKTKVRRPQTNGFVERFNRTLLDEFLRTAMRTTLYTSTDALQADLDTWLVHYNEERPHRGYRNMGKRPIETIRAFAARPEALPTADAQEAVPGAQAGSRADTAPRRGRRKRTLDAGEHRATNGANATPVA
jgi:transposase InsO family protein